MSETDFKRTDLGVIPKDWQILTLGDLGEPVMCKRILKEQTTSTGDIPFFKIGTFGGRPDAYISNDLYDLMRSQYSFPNKGDILISAAGTIGRLVIYDGKPSYFQDSNIVWINHSQEKIINPFLYYWLNGYKWDAETSCTISRLYNATIKAAKIIVPSLKEQKLISKTLQDIDDLISGLKNLIEKKRAIKAGAMSQLLSGKLHLPGFFEPWHTISLSQLSEFTNITMPCDIFDDSSYVCTENMKSDCGGIIAYEDIVPYVYSKSYMPFDILLSNIRPYLKKIWLADKSGCCSNDILAIRPNFELVSPHFLYYCLAQDCFFNYVMEGAAGTKMPRGNKTHISQYEFEIPSDLEEQKAIAKVLTDMDEEISALETKQKKYEQLKKGMMQQLLTGKIRLVSPNESLS